MSWAPHPSCEARPSKYNILLQRNLSSQISGFQISRISGKSQYLVNPQFISKTETRLTVLLFLGVTYFTQVRARMLTLTACLQQLRAAPKQWPVCMNTFRRFQNLSGLAVWRPKTGFVCSGVRANNVHVVNTILFLLLFISEIRIRTILLLCFDYILL